MNSPLISIIVPIYEVELYLDECVESLIRQTYNNIEIILVDDGSPDSCPLKCDQWAKKDSRIKVLHKPNGGLSDARNAGMEAAKGEYLGFVDSDDFIDEHMYEKLLEGFNMGEDVAVTAIKVINYIDGKCSSFSDAWEIDEPRRTEGKDFAIQMISAQRCYTAWNKLYKKSAVGNVKFRKGRTNEDTLFMFDLGKVMKANNYAFIELPYSAYYYRVRPNSICTTAKIPLDVDIVSNLEDMMSECAPDDTDLKQILRNTLIKRLYIFCDSLLFRSSWKPHYFKRYQKKLRDIPFAEVKAIYGWNDVLYIYLLKYCPILRKVIRKHFSSKPIIED